MRQDTEAGRARGHIACSSHGWAAAHGGGGGGAHRGPDRNAHSSGFPAPSYSDHTGSQVPEWNTAPSLIAACTPWSVSSHLSRLGTQNGERLGGGRSMPAARSRRSVRAGGPVGMARGSEASGE